METGTASPAGPGDPAARAGDPAVPGSGGRRLRRDAERNRQRILRAAALVFTERGLAASLDDVAREAGVGVATVYRRFPDKEALAEALFTERLDALAGLARDALAHPDPWTGLVTFLTRAVEMLARDRGLRQMLMFASYGSDRVNQARARMLPVVTALVQRAQRAGAVRADLSPTDIPMIEFMLATFAQYAQPVRPELWRRYLGIILDGLRPGQATAAPLPDHALSADEFAAAVRSVVHRGSF